MTVKTVIIASDTAELNGGIGKVVVTSAIALVALGVEVVIFCPLAGVEPALEKAGVTVVNLEGQAPSEDRNRLRGMARGIWNGRAAQALRALCSKYDPATTVLHCHGFSKGLSPAIGPILADGPLRHLYTMHEYFLACPNGAFFDFPRAEICTRTPMGLSCLTTQCDSRHVVHKMWRVARQAALRGPGKMPRGLRNVAYISDMQRVIMAPHLPDGTRLHHVANPVDIGEGPRVAAEENDLFVFVGRLEPDKGALDFAKAAKEAGVRAAFVGSGSQDEDIRALLPDAVITGWVGPNDVAMWLGRARALVFPSLWQETFGLVAYEALGRGVPVITGAWNAASEAITHGENGIVYQDANGLTDALKQMDAGKAGAMSRAAFDRKATYGLTPAAHAERLVAVYSAILQ